MIDPATFEKWQEWSKRDDAWKLFVPSDIRQMLGEIERLKTAVATVCDTFAKDESQGFHSRDREFALTILGPMRKSRNA